MICPECRKISRKALLRNSDDLTNKLSHFGKNGDTGPRNSNPEPGHRASAHEFCLRRGTYNGNFQLQSRDLRFIRQDSAVRARRFASRTSCFIAFAMHPVALFLSVLCLFALAIVWST